jgi:AraC family transcriptional regulator of adaptative response/methylated-DNA-[protein]-cysteine methyltransferase
MNNINYQRVEKAIEYLGQNFREQPDLDMVASKINISPFHFQKIFTEWAGVSPKRFLQYLNINFLKEKIRDTANVLEAADLAGLSSQSRVYDLFVTIEAVTPGEYKNGGKGMLIQYGYHQTPFGECFIAVTERGICSLDFLNEDSKESEFKKFREKWNFAKLLLNPQITESYINKVFSQEKNDQTSGNQKKIPLLVQGTNFQIKVWEALLKIPFGNLSTYEQVAKSINNPKALRAVGTAIGNNPVAYLIPCHRVIRKEGKIGNYYSGPNRKKAIIGWEMARKEEN